MGIFNINNSQQLLFGNEMSATMTGANVGIGTLNVPVAKLIFDNQGTAAVQIFVVGPNYGGSITAGIGTGGILWRTFPAGEAITIDGNDVNAKGPFAVGSGFYGVGASGVFSISYVYFKAG